MARQVVRVRDEPAGQAREAGDGQESAREEGTFEEGTCEDAAHQEGAGKEGGREPARREEGVREAIMIARGGPGRWNA